MEHFLETINNRPSTSIWNVFNPEFRNAQNIYKSLERDSDAVCDGKRVGKNKEKQVDKMKTGCRTLSIEIWLIYKS